MTLLEKVGWMTGIVTSITSQILLMLGGSHPTLKLGFLGGGLIILLLTGLLHYKKLPTLPFLSSETEFTPFRSKEKQDFYNAHLKNDIAILDKTKTEEKTNFYYAFAFTPHEKKLPIKAHFFTAEDRDPVKNRGLFSSYQKAVEINEDLYRKGVTLALIVSTLISSLQSLRYKSDHKTEKLWEKIWVIPEALETGMHFYGDITRFNETADFQLLLKFVRTSRFTNYSLTMDNDGKQEIIKLNGNAIVGTPTKEIGWKFFDLIQSEIEKFRKTAQDIIGINDIWFSAQKYGVDEIIKNNIEDIKQGILIMGVCKRCLECFTGTEKKKWNKSLNKFYSQRLDERY